MGMTITLFDVAMSYTANARKLGEVDVLCGQHTSASETMNQLIHNNTSGNVTNLLETKTYSDLLGRAH